MRAERAVTDGQPASPAEGSGRGAVHASGAYLTVSRAGTCVGTIGFDPGHPGVSRFVATTASGCPAGLITDAGRSFRVHPRDD